MRQVGLVGEQAGRGGQAPLPSHGLSASRQELLGLLRALPDDLDAFDSIVDDAVHRSASDGVDAWAALWRTAAEHGVTGVVDAGLARHTNLPDATRGAVLRRRAVAEAWQEHQLAELERAVTVLDGAGIDGCTLKGPALAARLYAPGATRHSVDLDLLVRAADLDRALHAFGAAGYATDSGPTAEYLRKHSHHLHLVRRGATPLELHFCAYAGFGVVLPAEWIFERVWRLGLPGGGTIGVPAPEEEVVYLAVHAAGHTYFRLMWLYDLKLLVRAHPSLDWERVTGQAVELGVGEAVRYSLRLLVEWMGVALPAEVIRRRGVRSRMADRLLGEVSAPQAPSARSNLSGLVFTSLLCDRVASGVGLVTHHVARSARRRLKRAVPSFLPDRWAG